MPGPISVDQLDRERYADVEALLVGWVRDSLAASLALVVSTEMPPADDLAAVLAEQSAQHWVQIEAFGGADKTPASETVSVDVTVYTPGDADGNPDRAGASDCAQRLRTALLFHLPGFDDGQATVSLVATISRPSPRPYDDNPVARKFGASYAVTVKTHS